MKENDKLIYSKLSSYLSKTKQDKLVAFYNGLKSEYKKNLFFNCLIYTIEKNKDFTRKTGGPNVVHPLNVGLKAIQYKLDYTIVCASFLHDVIEDQIEHKEPTVIRNFFMIPKTIMVNRSLLREEMFSKLKDELSNDLTAGIKKEANNDLEEIIKMIDILTQYKKNTNHYYDYIQNSFDPDNNEFAKQTIFNAILIKYIDRIDNISSMDTKLRDIINDKIKTELKILNLINSEKIKDKYRKLLSEQNSLLVDYSFSGGNRLNQIWKNTYLLIRTRMFIQRTTDLKNKFHANNIEKELILTTLHVLNNHKNTLRVYLPQKITRHWDSLAKKYKNHGGLKGKTIPIPSNKITKENEYLIYNSTIATFSQYLLKNNREFKRLQIDKETQYKYLALISELLNQFKNSSEFVCDLSKEINIQPEKKMEESTNFFTTNFLRTKEK